MFITKDKTDCLFLGSLFQSVPTTYLNSIVVFLLIKFGPLLTTLKFSIHNQSYVLQVSNSNPQERKSFYERVLVEKEILLDMLNAANHAMTNTNQILAILNGLGDEYESVIAIIYSREVPYTLQHVSTLLLSHEDRILQKTSSAELSGNFVNYKKTSNWGSQNKNQGERGYNGNRGRGRGGRSNINRSQRQLCGRIGHTVIKCFKACCVQ